MVVVDAFSGFFNSKFFTEKKRQQNVFFGKNYYGNRFQSIAKRSIVVVLYIEANIYLNINLCISDLNGLKCNSESNANSQNSKSTNERTIETENKTAVKSTQSLLALQ